MYLGVDIGGTKIRAALLDSKFRVVRIVEIQTQANKTKAVVLNNIYGVITELLDRKVRGIGLAMRGQVDFKQGVVVESTMMPGRFKDVPLAKLVKTKFGKKVLFDNDTNCFTLAESLLGAGRGKQNVVGITLGTGIGGGIVINGKIYHGTSAAGEIGHMIIKADSYKWNCGQRGCFESLCSGKATVRQYKMVTNITLKELEIEARFKKGEPAARLVFRNMSQYLSIGLANVIHILSPDMIVIGGGLGKVKFYVDPAIRQAKDYVVYRDLKKTPIKYARLGGKSGVIGAALLFKQ